jgi:hypothetical protein
MITTLQQFLDRARTATADQIYEMFEHQCDDALRVEIYDYCPETEFEREPMRASMFALGKLHNIQSLIDY